MEEASIGVADVGRSVSMQRVDGALRKVINGRTEDE
jgi:hypothetical protein